MDVNQSQSNSNKIVSNLKSRNSPAMIVTTSNDDLNHELSSPLIQQMKSLGRDLYSTKEHPNEQDLTKSLSNQKDMHMQTDEENSEESPFESNRLTKKHYHDTNDGKNHHQILKTQIDQNQNENGGADTNKTQIAVMSFGSRKILPETFKNSQKEFAKCQNGISKGDFILEGTSLSRLHGSKDSKRQSPLRQNLDNLQGFKSPVKKSSAVIQNQQLHQLKLKEQVFQSDEGQTKSNPYDFSNYNNNTQEISIYNNQASTLVNSPDGQFIRSLRKITAPNENGYQLKQKDEQQNNLDQKSQIEVQIKSSLDSYQIKNPQQYLTLPQYQQSNQNRHNNSQIKTQNGINDVINIQEQNVEVHSPQEFRTHQLEMMPQVKFPQRQQKPRLQQQNKDIVNIKELNKRNLVKGGSPESKSKSINSQSLMIDSSSNLEKKALSNIKYANNVNYYQQTTSSESLSAPPIGFKYDNSVQVQADQFEQFVNIQKVIDSSQPFKNFPELANNTNKIEPKQESPKFRAPQILLVKQSNKNHLSTESEHTSKTIEQHKSSMQDVGNMSINDTMFQSTASFNHLKSINDSHRKKQDHNQMMQNQFNKVEHKMINLKNQNTGGALSKKKKEESSPIRTKFHRTQHTWNFTLQPEFIKDIEINPKKYYKDKETIPSMALKFKHDSIIPNLKKEALIQTSNQVRLKSVVQNQICCNKLQFQNGQLVNKPRKLLPRPKQILSYREREEKAFENKTIQKQQIREYKQNMKEQTNQFKQMMREGGLGDQVSETATETLFSSSQVTPLSDRHYKPLDLPQFEPMKISEQSETNYQNSSQKDHLKSMTMAFGKEINNKIAKIVPQKDGTKGPYGEPYMLKEDSSFIKINKESKTQLLNEKESFQLIQQQFQELNQQTSRYKPCKVNDQDEHPQQSLTDEHIKSQTLVSQTLISQSQSIAEDQRNVVEHEYLKNEQIIQDSLMSISHNALNNQSNDKTIPDSNNIALQVAIGANSAHGPFRKTQFTEDSFSNKVKKQSRNSVRQTPQLGSAHKETMPSIQADTQNSTAGLRLTQDNFKQKNHIHFDLNSMDLQVVDGLESSQTMEKVQPKQIFNKLHDKYYGTAQNFPKSGKAALPPFNLNEFQNQNNQSIEERKRSRNKKYTSGNNQFKKNVSIDNNLNHSSKNTFSSQQKSPFFLKQLEGFRKMNQTQNVFNQNQAFSKKMFAKHQDYGFLINKISVNDQSGSLNQGLDSFRKSVGSNELDLLQSSSIGFPNGIEQSSTSLLPLEQSIALPALRHKNEFSKIEPVMESTCRKQNNLSQSLNFNNWQPSGIQIKDPAVIQQQLQMTQNSARQFNASFMQSPKLKNQFISTRQYLNKSVQGRDYYQNTNRRQLIRALHRQDPNYINSIQKRSNQDSNSPIQIQNDALKQAPDTSKVTGEQIQMTQQERSRKQSFISNIEQNCNLTRNEQQTLQTNQTQVTSVNNEHLKQDKDIDNIKYQNFKNGYQLSYAYTNPMDSPERYQLGDISSTIELADNIIQYKEEVKLNQQDKKQSFNANTQSSTMIASNQARANLQKLINIVKKQKKDSFSNKGLRNGSDGESESVSELSRQQISKGNKRNVKMPKLCRVEQIAIKFMFDCYERDSRYTIEPDERQRISTIIQNLNVPLQQYIQQKESRGLNLDSQDEFIECRDHANEGSEAAAQIQFNRFQNFYNSLMDPKHNKVNIETLCQQFIEVIMDPKEKNFSSLRSKIINEGDNEDKFETLRKLNQEIFLKQDKIEQDKALIKEHNSQVVETMDTKAHHKFSVIPNRKIMANQEIMETLVKSMIQQESATDSKIDKKKNQLMENNIVQRNNEKRQKKLINKLQIKLNQQERKQSEMSLDKFKSGLLGNFNQQLDDYMHFQNAAKQDVNQRVQSKDIQKILSKDIFSVIKGNKQNMQLLLDSLKGNLAKQLEDQLEFKPKFTDEAKKLMQKVNIKAEQPELVNTTTPENETLSSLEDELPDDSQIIFLKQLEQKRFYNELKENNIKNHDEPGPIIAFYQELKASNCVVIPHFVKIRNYTLAIQNEFVNSETIMALSNYIIAESKLIGLQRFRKLMVEKNTDLVDPSQIYVRHLILDDCGMVDNDFAVLLAALSIQGKLKSITYRNNQLGRKSLIALNEIISCTVTYDKPVVSQDENQKQKDQIIQTQGLEALKLTNCKCDKLITIRLLQELEYSVDSKPLKQFHLSGFDLNHRDIVYYLNSIFEYNCKLKELNLSNCQIQQNLFCQIVEGLAQQFLEAPSHQQLSSLNLSYNQLSNQSNDYDLRIVDSICSIIAESVNLTHLDLSGMNLQEHVRPIINQINEAKNQILISIHLHDNQFDLKTKDWILKQMGIQTSNYHRLHDQSNLVDQDQMEMSILYKSFQDHSKLQSNVHKFFKHPEVQKPLEVEASFLNNQIQSELKQIKNNVKTAESIGGAFRDNLSQDPMLFTRKIGHPELIFNSNLYWPQEYSMVNSEEQWSYSNSSVGDDCYVCQKHSYMQIFFRRSTAKLDFTILEDEEIKQTLIKTYHLDKEQFKNGSPILMSSANNWILTRFLDVKLFSQLLKGQNDEFINQSIQKQEKQKREEFERLKQSRTIKVSTNANADNLEGDIEQQKSPEPNKINIDQDFDSEAFRKKEAMKVKFRSKNIRNSIAGIGSGYSHIIGSSSQTLRQQTTKEFIDNDENYEMTDMIAAREWREVIKECQKYRKEMISINHPPDQKMAEQTFIFAGFVKPGRHIVFIYDPNTREFFKKDLIAEFRKSEIILEKKKAPGVDANRLDNEILEQDDFIFKQWRFDNADNLKIVIQSDLRKHIFSSAALDMKQQLYFTVINSIPSNFPWINQAYKIYLLRNDYPSSDVEKFCKFLLFTNIIIEHDDTSQKGVPKLCRNQVQKIFENEQGKREVHDHVIYRFEFIQKILMISYKNFRLQKESKDFLQYFQNTTVQTLKQYVLKLGAGADDFRRNSLWKTNVNAILKLNEGQIIQTIQRYSINRSFTLDAAIYLLDQAKIDLSRPTSKLSHLEQVKRIFGMSKQTVINEANMYYYTFLEEIEAFEFFARIADNYYHISYSQLNLKDPKLIQLQKFSMQPLEMKIYELLKTHIAPLTDIEIQEIKELQMDKARKQIQITKETKQNKEQQQAALEASNSISEYDSIGNLSQIAEEIPQDAASNFDEESNQ